MIPLCDDEPDERRPPLCPAVQQPQKAALRGQDGAMPPIKAARPRSLLRVEWIQAMLIVAEAALPPQLRLPLV